MMKIQRNLSASPPDIDVSGFSCPSISSEDELRSRLIDIEDEMGLKDVDNLKFLCRGVIPFGPLERCSSALEVFDYLKSSGKISLDNVDFLLECLGRIGRVDLIKKLGYDGKLVAENLDGYKKLLPLRVLLFDIAEEIGSSELNRIKFWLEGRVSRKKLRDVSCSLSLIILLEQEGHIMAENVKILIDLMNLINRPDLLRKVYGYQGREDIYVRENPPFHAENNAQINQPFIPGREDIYVQEIPPFYAENNAQINQPFIPGEVNNGNCAGGNIKNKVTPLPPRPLGGRAVGGSFSAGTITVPSPERSAANDPESSAEQLPENVDLQPNLGLEQLENAMKVAGIGTISQNPEPRHPQQTVAQQPFADLEPDLPEYDMRRKPRGVCLIINNRDFQHEQNIQNGQDFQPRLGTEADEESLKSIFGKLGFRIEVKRNLTSTEMSRTLVEIAHNVDHEQFDCFVCCILSHGIIGHVYGVDGKEVAIRDLTASFQANRCPSLAGKPKIFFIQACQGREKMGGGRVERDGNDLQTDGDKDFIPNEADFLLGYATVPGYAAFRSRENGSWYIRKLVHMLHKYADRFDLMSILVKVNEEVSHANANLEGGIYKQVPAPMVTLRKKVYFR